MKPEISILFVILIVFINLNCKDKCPTSDVVIRLGTPVHVEVAKAVYRPDTMVFVSEFNDVKEFIKKSETDNLVIRSDVRVVECDENDEVNINVFNDSEISEFVYESSDGSTFIVKFFPGNYSEDYSKEEISNGEDVVFRMNVNIKIPGSNFDRYLYGKALWRNQNTLDFFDQPLIGGYKVNNIEYQNVSFSPQPHNGPPNYYYIENYECVGFVDYTGLNWIKLK